MSTYAYAFGCIEAGKMPTEQAFQQVANTTEGFTWGQPSTYPGGPTADPVREPPWHLYQQTMHESRYATTIDMAKKWKQGDNVIRKLTNIERQAKRKALMNKYGPLSGCMVGEREPSEALEDILHTWKELDRITHPLSLAECTSIEMEWNLRRTQPTK